MVQLKTYHNENSIFFRIAQYFITKFCTIICKGCLHYYDTFYKILLINIEMAGT